MKYIDAEKLKAKIERRLERYDPDYTNAGSELKELLSFVTSLQQEQPVVDLDEEVHRFFEECIEVHEVPLYGKVKERVISVDCYEITARHFYELGRNARKEE